MARKSLSSQVREVSADIMQISLTLSESADGTAQKLGMMLAAKCGKLDALCGLDRIERGLPYNEEEPISLTVVAEPDVPKPPAKTSPKMGLPRTTGTT